MANHEFPNRIPIPLPRLPSERIQLNSPEPDAQPTWTPKPTNRGRFSEKKLPPDGPVPAFPAVPVRR